MMGCRVHIPVPWRDRRDCVDEEVYCGRSQVTEEARRGVLFSEVCAGTKDIRCFGGAPATVGVVDGTGGYVD
jgi:hypothetical protein